MPLRLSNHPISGWTLELHVPQAKQKQPVNTTGTIPTPTSAGSCGGAPASSTACTGANSAYTCRCLAISPAHRPTCWPNEGAGSTLAQFAIRVEEHQRTAEATMRQAVQTAGYNAQAFGLDGGEQPITATEVDSRDARSMVTRRKKAGYWRRGLADMLHVMLQVDRAQLGSSITPERPRVEFGDGVAQSEQQTATTLDLLHRAGAVSTATEVKVLHPEWDDTAVQAEVDAILAETGAAAPDPVGMFPLSVHDQAIGNARTEAA